MPNVVTIPAVEIVKVGSWDCSSGPWTVTAADLAAAVAAHRAGVLPRAPIHLGHDTAMRDGSPALGYLDGLRTTSGGNTLVADLVGVPRAVAAVIRAAYKDRSVEALIDYEAPDGTVWPLVIQGLALLGGTRAGIPTLAGLPDVLDLYGIAASSARRVVVAATPSSPVADHARAVAIARARRARTYRTTTV